MTASLGLGAMMEYAELLFPAVEVEVMGMPAISSEISTIAELPRDRERGHSGMPRSSLRLTQQR
jgi:hypothetical protein